MAPALQLSNPRPASAVFRLACAFALLLGGLRAGTETAPKEYEIKAAFLYNFTKFVSWPAESFADANAPIVIGVYGRSPFGRDLVDAIGARKVGARAIELRSVSNLDEARAAHVVFFPAGEERAAEPLLAALRDAAVLTVGESETFRGQGGVITFVVERDKLRFVIDMNAADRAGLKVSAQLQKLAQRVQRNS